MCRPKNAQPVTTLEIEAAIRLRTEDRLSWARVGKIMRRERSVLRKAIKRHTEQRIYESA